MRGLIPFSMSTTGSVHVWIEFHNNKRFRKNTGLGGTEDIAEAGAKAVSHS
jgi:hypothetical protein